MVMEQNIPDDYRAVFGTRYHIKKNNVELVVSRNNSTGTFLSQMYHLTVGGRGIVLNNEDFVDLFNAFLKMQEEYEQNKPVEIYEPNDEF